MIIHVYANQSNVGDWLSAIGIQSLISPLDIEECFCDEPFVPATLERLSRATADDFIVVGGGGLFMDYFVPFWEGFRPIADRVPFGIWGAGYCDMKREDSRPPRELIAEIVKRSHFCLVRDELTRSFLPDCELPPSVICPTVVAVPTSVAGEPGSLLHVDHYDNVGEHIYDGMVSAATHFASCTGRRYRQTNNLIPSGDRAALRRTLDLYSAADMVITSRLHGCIIALATGRRVLAVSGDRKVESFMGTAGLSEWVCDLDDVASVPLRLERLHEQVIPMEFIERGRLQNRAVGETVALMQSPSRARSPVR